MKKYIKPSIEELHLGVYTPIADSPGIPVDTDGTVVDPGNMWAPGKKGSADDWEDEEEDTGFGW